MTLNQNTNFIIGGLVNVAVGAVIRGISGENVFDSGAIATDAVIGVATSGLGAISQLRYAAKLAQAGRIIGSAQKTQTLGHATRSLSEAVSAINRGASTVWLDRSVGGAIGQKAIGQPFNLRPDVLANFGQGTFKVMEITSRSQTLVSQANKAAGIASFLGSNSFGRAVGVSQIGPARFVQPFTLTTGLGTSSTLGSGLTAFKNLK